MVKLKEKVNSRYLGHLKFLSLIFQGHRSKFFGAYQSYHSWIIHFLLARYFITERHGELQDLFTAISK